jgi:hypothetical protein
LSAEDGRKRRNLRASAPVMRGRCFLLQSPSSPPQIGCIFRSSCAASSARRSMNLHGPCRLRTTSVARPHRLPLGLARWKTFSPRTPARSSGEFERRARAPGAPGRLPATRFRSRSRRVLHLLTWLCMNPALLA